ncbi:hypothetical protein F5887DRAFT_1076627 [Amanita rubescens]|nr:hypothetical protein F5887DRAFT_1076627 [Amanita rubescens]
MAESPEWEQLRQRFRNVIALYRLVRCINEGYPSLPDSSAPKLEALPSRRNVLEAITTILVVDHEILAAASFSEATDNSQVSVTGSLVCVSSDEVVQELRNPRQSPLENANTEHTADIDLDFPLEIDTEGINTHSTKVVAISNPHTAHQKLPQFQFSSTNPQGLCLVKDGRDLWCMIKDDDEDTGWENIIQNQPTLPDHVTTLNSYLNDYRLSTSQCQKQFERKFSKYLIAACWRKMHRQMTTWSSLGLLYNLAHIPTETLRKITNKRTVVFDQRLSRYLTILKESHSDVLFGYNPVTVEPRMEQIPRPNIALLQKTTGYNIIYNDAETAINFHQFFIHLLLGFVKALARLSKAMKRKVNESPDIKEITSAIASAAPIVRALVMVVHSDALETHLQTLRTTEAELRMPTIDSIPNYTKFAAANDLILGKGYKDAKGKGRDKGAKDEDKGVESRDKGAKDEDKGVESRDKGAKDEDKGVERRDMNTKGEGKGEGMNEGGTNDEDENENENGYPGYGEAEEDENADLVRSAYTADHTVLRRWIMTFVGHFSAKRILERHVTGAGLDKPVDIRLIAVKRASAFLSSWDDMKGLIKDVTAPLYAFQPDDFVRRCVEKLSTHVMPNASDNASGNASNEMTSQPERWGFGMLLNADIKSHADQDGLVKYTGCQHCEIIVAVLMLYYQEFIPDSQENRELLNLCKKLDHRWIAVSKRCCPVCWELLSILREHPSHPALEVRGRHSTVYQVDLLPGLPVPVIRNLLDFFEHKLYDELKNLDQSGRGSHKRNLSIESDAGLSTGTISTESLDSAGINSEIESARRHSLASPEQIVPELNSTPISRSGLRRSHPKSGFSRSSESIQGIGSLE